MSHPHDPYVARSKYWDLYNDCMHLDPAVPAIPFADQDPHSQRLHKACDSDTFEITPENTRRARQGYFANISYVDDKVGELLNVLAATRMADDTVVMFCSDHGDMLGERGLWFKMSMFEGSSRVPLMIAGAGLPAGRIDTPTTNLDICPTLCAFAGIDISAIAPWTDGQSLIPLAGGQPRSEPVAIEYAAEGSDAPLVCLVADHYKIVHCALDPVQLFDLATDPQERTNLATDPAHAETLATLMDQITNRWDMPRFDAAVRESQARRWIVYPALRNGAYFPWDFQPLQKASEQYMRNHMDLNVLEGSKRFPRGE
jgi:choline-sulfatase